jgi:glucose-1-phosphate thymidylyltransferase
LISLSDPFYRRLAMSNATWSEAQRGSGAGVHKAVIMTRGLGTRMRRGHPATALSPEQAAAADRGLKGLIPLGGSARPFLDYVISGLADAGFDHVCLIIGPEHDALRRQYTVATPPTRLRLSFAVQVEPRGTADAVAAARAFADGDHFLVINSDNYYPVDVLRALRLLGRPALPGFDRDGLITLGNVDPDRVARFALLRVTRDGDLEGIVEKPDAATMAAMGPDALVSMNCWLFGPLIFEACAHVTPSARGELELADAVQWAIASGERFKVLRYSRPVLDLTSRADVEDVARRLRDVDVRL